MTIRLILILTVFALVLGGVGAAFVQAQTTDPGSCDRRRSRPRPRPCADARTGEEVRTGRRRPQERRAP